MNYGSGPTEKPRDAKQRQSSIEEARLKVETRRLEIERGTSRDEYWKIALKSALLLNGGAAIALMAFLGSSLPRSGTSELLLSLAQHLRYFAIGAGLGGLAVLGTMLLVLTDSVLTKNRDETDGAWTQNMRSLGGWWGLLLVLVTCGSLIASLLLFVVGVFNSSHEFRESLPSNATETASRILMPT